MSNPLIKAKILRTGKETFVYKHIQSGKYIDYSDCVTMYDKNELELSI